MDRIVLAYSGGLDTSVAVPWLAEKYNAEVICATLDLGQGKELESVRERALAAGAIRCHVLDVREEFADRYILPALQAGAMTRTPGISARADTSMRTWSLPLPVQPWAMNGVPSMPAISTTFFAMSGRPSAVARG